MILEKIKELFNLGDKLPEELVEYVIIYLRKSRKDMEYGKDEPIEATLARHEEALQEWACRVFGRKIPEKNIFREVVSGDTIADRPEMQKVLELIENDDVKAVLCVETERLARGNSIDQGILAQKFLYTNTKIFTLDKIYDLNDEHDLEYFEDGLHQSRKYLQYVKKILNRGRERSVREGKFVGSQANFGYDKVKLEKEKGFTLEFNDDINTVRKIYDLYLYEDLGTTNIAKKLNTLGLKSPTSVAWTAAMVRNFLVRAHLYAGYITWNRRKIVKKYVNGQIIDTRPLNDDYILVKGRHPAILSEDELQLILKKMKGSSAKTVKNGYSIKNPLAGLIRCAFCNHSMVRRPYTKSFVKSGVVHKDTLICITLNCKNVSSDLDIVEQRVLDFLKLKLKQYKNYLSNYDIESANVKEKIEKEKEQVLKKISLLNSQKQKCCEFLETGIYDEKTFATRVEALNQELDSANSTLVDLENKIKNSERLRYRKAIPLLAECINNYDKYTCEKKNKVLLSIIDVIYYKKTNKRGRWDTSAKDDFELEIRLKI